jgi:hypothetical protein
MNKHLIKTTSLLCCLVLLAVCAFQQVDFLDELQVKYEQYQKKYPSVKINIIFNQPLFSPGDTAYFKAWYTDESNHPITGDHIVSFDVISGTGVLSQRIRFKVKEGSAYNQIVFDKELSPGIYRLIAYTDWMKNFGDSWYYEKRIKLENKNKIDFVKNQTSAINFFPEGGDLIGGISNKLAITGTPLKSLTIKNNKDFITTINLDSTGLAIINFLPEFGNPYYVEDSEGKKWMLPEIKKDGVSIQLNNAEESISLLVAENSKFFNENLYAVITGGGKILSKKEIVFTQDKGIHLVTMPKTDQKLNEIFVINSLGKVLSQRVFINGKQEEGISLNIELPASAQQRESLTAKISIVADSKTPVVSEMTVTVVNNDLFTDFELSNYEFSELPDLNERVEGFKFSTEALNDFLITQKWSRIDWTSIVTSRKVDITFPFRSQSTLKGQVLSKKTGLPPPDSTVLLTYLQKNTVGYEYYMDKGKIEMPLIFDFWGNDFIFCTIQKNSKVLDKDYVISLIEDSIKISQRWSSIENQEPSQYGEFEFKRNLVSNSFNYFQKEQEKEEIKTLNPNSLIEEEFMGVDYTVNVTDYLIFPKMEDLLREVVPFVQYRKRGNEENVKMLFRYEKSTKSSKGDPLYVIDGQLSRDTEYFLSLKPEDILYLKILNNVNKLSQLGKLGENGVIFIESKKANLAPNTLGKNLFPIVGLNHQLEFNNNDKQPNNSTRIPNLKSTLYWNPSLKVTSSEPTTINFYTRDNIGKIKVIVRGLTAKGNYFSAEKVIDVGFNSKAN